MEKFDVIVVGAGLAGLAAAYTMSREGLEVVLLERGEYAGSKNVTGGRLYVNPVRHLFPDLWDQAPFERFITHEGFSMMAADRSITVGYYGNELNRAPYQSYSVLRSRFDRWLAEQAEAQGAMLLSSAKVDDVIIENGKITGVLTGDDGLHADVVIACDGVLSLIAEKAGLRNAGMPRDYAVGIKEVIELDPDLINARFNLEGDEGAARLFFGDITKGRFGGGFLYTNRESISLGIVVGIKALMEGEAFLEAPAFFDGFKERPEIAALIKDGTTVEYSAHVIPEGGYRSLTPLSGNGILVAGDAAGLALNLGVTVRGMEYALASGYYAAQTVLQAKDAGDYGAEKLAVYKTMLENSFVLEDFRNFRETPAVLDERRIVSHYPELFGKIMKDLYEIPGGPKNRLYPTIRRYLTIGEMLSMFKDFRKVMKI
ncbi:MAG: FAD-dependent oxidoreductase [Deltaproteobacteria bacterium]|nr:FAD-dependent oxidoreductase [Deltaproteobacteria bacterium]MBN2688951.1 FAD-dependent oxidoreductase [Deltaproteobacteria bacterium]